MTLLVKILAVLLHKLNLCPMQKIKQSDKPGFEMLSTHSKWSERSGCANIYQELVSLLYLTKSGGASVVPPLQCYLHYAFEL